MLFRLNNSKFEIKFENKNYKKINPSNSNNNLSLQLYLFVLVRFALHFVILKKEKQLKSYLMYGGLKKNKE